MPCGTLCSYEKIPGPQILFSTKVSALKMRNENETLNPLGITDLTRELGACAIDSLRTGDETRQSDHDRDIRKNDDSQEADLCASCEIR